MSPDIGQDGSQRLLPLYFCAFYGDAQTIEWLHAHGGRLVPDMCTLAVMGERLPMLCWLCAHDCQPSEHALYVAIEKGHVAIVQTLLEACRPTSSDAYDLATRLGHHEIARLLRERRGQKGLAPVYGKKKKGKRLSEKMHMSELISAISSMCRTVPERRNTESDRNLV